MHKSPGVGGSGEETQINVVRPTYHRRVLLDDRDLLKIAEDLPG